MKIASDITVDSNGTPIITRTRTPVASVVSSFADGMSKEEVMCKYDLASEEVAAALRYAADLPKLNKRRIQLYQGSDIQISNGDQEGDQEFVSGSIYLDWSFAPKLMFEIELNGTNFPKDKWEITLQMLNWGSLSKASITRRETNKCENKIVRCALKGIFHNSVTTVTAKELNCLTFKLVNFGITYPLGKTIFLEAQGWKIKISVSSVRDSKKPLLPEEDYFESCGGYAETHEGKIERLDGGTFDSESIKDLSEALHYFFSFVQGFWIDLILLVGLDKEENKVWEHWSGGKIDRWQSYFSWFNRREESLCKVFSGFMTRWQDPYWKEAIKIAIQLYIECNKNAGEDEGSIVLQQTVFELLSWAVMVEDKQIFTQEVYKNVRAAKKLENLLKQFGIDMQIPTQLKALTKLSKTEQNCKTGPYVLEYLRNQIVHPKRKSNNNGKTPGKIWPSDVEARGEAWLLGQWYLRLILLNVFNYQGKYLNWIENQSYAWKDEGEIVPWADNAAARHSGS
jgi:uncharacterized protein (DUF433 family)